MNNSLQTDDELAQIIWDFNVAIDSVERVDLILVLGSNDIRVAQRGAQLFKEGFGSRLMFSGNVGKFTEHWLKSEAETFAHEAVHMGVPKDKIIIENESTNTGENIVFSQKKLQELRIFPQSYILVQKPYMLRRSAATFKKYLPDSKVYFTSPQLTFSDYPDHSLSKKHVICNLVGAIKRLLSYPQKGFQIHTDISDDVLSAYKVL